jgi:hypothetical protein
MPMNSRLAFITILLLLTTLFFSACGPGEAVDSSSIPVPTATDTPTQVPTSTRTFTPSPTFGPTRSCIVDDGDWSGWIGKAIYVFFSIRKCQIVESGFTVSDSTPVSFSQVNDDPVTQKTFSVIDSWPDTSVIISGKFTSSQKATTRLSIKKGTKLKLSNRVVSFDRDWVAEFECFLALASTGTPQAGTPVPAPTRAYVTPACIQAAFASDLSIPEGAMMPPGTTFVKSWRIRNYGTCTWTTNFSIVFSFGDIMQGQATHPLSSRAVGPGEYVDISITLTAPSAPGSYRGYWMLSTAQGQLFGLGEANDPLVVSIEVVQ